MDRGMDYTYPEVNRIYTGALRPEILYYFIIQKDFKLYELFYVQSLKTDICS
jgi:hypothetical protein